MSLPEGYSIPAEDDALLSECDVNVFRGTGPGGQSVNTTDSAVRLRHRPTGLTVVCRRERSQLLNKRACVKRLRERLEGLAYQAPPRTPTRPSARAKAARLNAKRIRSTAKARRSKPTEDD